MTDKKISLKVINAVGITVKLFTFFLKQGNELVFKVTNKVKLAILMDKYCSAGGLVPGSVRFTFDGIRLDPKKTIGDMDMKDMDIIDAMVEQTGGC